MNDTTGIESGREVRRSLALWLEHSLVATKPIGRGDIVDLLEYIEDLEARVFPAELEALVEKIGPAPVQVIETSSYFGVYRLGFPGDRPRLVAAFAKPHDDSKTNADTFAALLNFFARRHGAKVETVQAEPAEESAERKALRLLAEAIRAGREDYGIGHRVGEILEDVERLLDGRAH